MKLLFQYGIDVSDEDGNDLDLESDRDDCIAPEIGERDLEYRVLFELFLLLFCLNR